MRVASDIHTRGDRHYPDVVMRAGADAIKTKRAVEIADFVWEMKLHFATALTLISEQAIMRLATGADSRFAHFDFKRRDQRGDKLELTNGTNIFAEARAAKERIQSEGGEEIIDD